MDIFQVCAECSEEFCSGTCREFQYDSYQRLIIEEKEKDAGAGAGGGALNQLTGSGGLKTKGGKGKKKAGKGGKKSKGKSAVETLLASMS